MWTVDTLIRLPPLLPAYWVPGTAFMFRNTAINTAAMLRFTIRSLLGTY